ncbi:aminoglycoside phosphotransferase family protein [Janibacter melonis]|uniref:aminoglycoside phosphotransferase family protein n=1 Tax=Janibacter melonis TaxID=262209 RepID=UPI001918DF52|nr:aminoglycoside phosphotransferase family protein [Janibacter melonis]
MELPPALVEGVRGLAPDGGPSGADWVEALPALLTAVLEDWGLVPDGPARHGRTALVVPVAGADLPRGGAALKLVWPHAEASTEHLALRRWDGDGAVRLLRADPSRGALLLERLGDEDLTQMWDEQACEVVAELYGRLHVAPYPQAPRLSAWLAHQSEALAASGDVLPRRLVARARSLMTQIAQDPACDATLVHTDLHFENVLSDGTDWVAIDPEPMAGHPAFEIAPMLWNRADEMGTGSSLRYLVRRRAEVLCERSGIAWEQARDHTVVRECVNAMWAAQAGDRERVSVAMSLVKALED